MRIVLLLHQALALGARFQVVRERSVEDSISSSSTSKLRGPANLAARSLSMAVISGVLLARPFPAAIFSASGPACTRDGDVRVVLHQPLDGQPCGDVGLEAGVEVLSALAAAAASEPAFYGRVHKVFVAQIESRYPIPTHTQKPMTRCLKVSLGQTSQTSSSIVRGFSTTPIFCPARFKDADKLSKACLLYTSPSPRD